jgi:hypothetical protein
MQCCHINVTIAMYPLQYCTMTTVIAIAMSTQQLKYNNGNMAMALWQSRHGNGNMAMAR